MSSLLEVDEAILTRHLKFEDTEDEALENLFPQPSESEVPSKVVLPTAGFCLKTTCSESSKKKAFINVCHSDCIPSPTDISQDELKAIWTSGEQGSYRIPMSIANPREEKDKRGEACDVYDVAISTMFFKKKITDVYFRTFLLKVMFEGLANKHGAQLSMSNGIILKNRKAMGTIQPHRIQIRHPSEYRKLIEDVGHSKVPEYILKLEGRKLVCRFHVPEVPEREIRLQLGEDRLRVVAPPTYFVDMFMPFFVDADNVTASFDCQTDILTVTVPVSRSDS